MTGKENKAWLGKDWNFNVSCSVTKFKVDETVNMKRQLCNEVLHQSVYKEVHYIAWA